jgi:hypothetical protein
MGERCLPARAAAIALSVCVAACSATFQEPRHAKSESHSVWASYYLVGLIGHNDVDVRDHCPSGQASEVKTGTDVATLGVSLLTIGIYTPRRVLVTCAPVKPR